MKQAVWTCPPQGQYRFGRIALDEHTGLNTTSVIMPSDTLSAGIIATAYAIFSTKEAEALSKAFQDGNVRVSSLFHYLKIGDNKIFFLPKPAHYDLLEHKDHKKVRKVRFISTEVWKKGWGPAEWAEQCIVLQDQFVISKNELPGDHPDQFKGIKIYSEQTIPKVVVHKPNREDSDYAQTNIQLASNWEWQQQEGMTVEVGWHFLFDDEQLSDTVAPTFHATLQILTDTGIGGERNTGCGELLSIDISSFELKVDDPEPKVWSSISLLLPEKEALSSLHFYHLITRGGRKTARHGRLHRIKMVDAGALINDQVKGKTANISSSPEQAYWRCGHVLSLPIHKKTLENVELPL